MAGLLLVCAGNSASAGDGTVKLVQGDDTVRVMIGGEAFAVYNFNRDLPKPYFSPVRAPGGGIVTREVSKPKDHPHHRGVWVSVDEVNGTKFWAEDGRIKNTEVTLSIAEGNPARMRVRNDWINAQGERVIKESTEIAIYPNRLMSLRVQLKSCEEQVTFDDTKEGFFGIRVADSMRETQGGRIINADGMTGSLGSWGRASDWVDYSGPVGEETVGVAIFDHPLNFRPSRFHVRGYGLFSISPFGESAYTNGRLPADPVVLLPESSLVLRYGLYVHAGNAETGRVSEAYVDYLKRKA
jgi:hypothetical protein